MAYKQSPFPMIAGTSPVKSKTWLAKQALKYGTKAVNWAKGKLATTATKTKTVPKTTTPKSKIGEGGKYYLKHDTKSGHLRFQTGRTAQGGKPTQYNIPVMGRPGGGLTSDPMRTHRLPAGVDLKKAESLVRGYRTR